MVRTTLNGKTYLSLDAGATATRLTAKQSQLIAKCTSVDPFEGSEGDEFYQQLIENPGDHSPVEIRCAIRQHGISVKPRRRVGFSMSRSPAQRKRLSAQCREGNEDDLTGLARAYGEVWSPPYVGKAMLSSQA